MIFPEFWGAEWGNCGVKYPGDIRRSKIKFHGESGRYTVRACNQRFAICTKPFNLRHTVLYTIVDYERDIRGTENLIFGLGFETDDQCSAALARLTAGESAVSSRNCVPLMIQEVSDE
jgi:hypothetical protein